MSRRAALVFATIGTAVSAYLTWIHYSGAFAFCAGVGDCEVVQTSRYSMLGPIPVALIGLAGMVLIFGVSLGRLVSDDPRLDLALFALALMATAYVAYLSYVEVFVLGAICPWCVAVAVCSVAIFALAARDVMSASS
ncbi:MAG TPA: vitamin K epoxide reductase family protein [Candidatus Limnocylindria bacterium]|nr:vitamin K epoxide reductase family protein [Candidatus Limnocylindria bacterium]